MKNAYQLHSLIAGVVLAMSVASSSILAADMPSEKDAAKEKVIFQVSAGDPNSPLKYTKILMLFSSSSDFQKGLLS
ncbi:MAG: hypothetical protein U0997_15475 [Sulfurimicrobium sp.]|nr:hypothetical protein [Sulfurimicrobium sp.]